jgi:hypothetical protein
MDIMLLRQSAGLQCAVAVPVEHGVQRSRSATTIDRRRQQQQQRRRRRRRRRKRRRKRRRRRRRSNSAPRSRYRGF